MGLRTSKNIEVYGRTSRDSSEGLNRLSCVRWSALEWVSEAGQLRFPSVPDRPLQHLSPLESTGCGRPKTIIAEIVIDLLMSSDHLRRFA
jgi:hypothetical protein